MMNLSTSPARGLRNVFFGVAVALAGASLTAVAQPGGEHAGHHGHHSGAMMGGSPRHMERMLDSVNATDEQRAEVRRISQAAATDMKDRRAASRTLREQQMQLFTQPTVDANAVEALRKQMLAEHDQSSQRMTQALLEISRVLTPEQRVQIAEKMKARHGMMKRHHREHRPQDKPAG
jgi:Spy/CpxP family protein refolding chaperone